MSDAPTPKLRWYHFSLRSLLLFFLFCSIPFGWLGMRMQRAREQRQGVEAIRKLGGSVYYDYHYDSSGALILGTDSKPPGPSWLRRILGDDFFADVVGVFLGRTQVTDADLEHLKGFSQLRNLALSGTGVTDAGLEQLQGLSQLRALWLDGTRVTDAGLEHLKALSQLQALTLDGTQVTDAGLRHVKGLSQLWFLHLSATKVTDAGLEHLKGRGQLCGLWLGGTRVTDEGVKNLQQALPHCKIVHWTQPPPP